MIINAFHDHYQDYIYTFIPHAVLFTLLFLKVFHDLMTSCASSATSKYPMWRDWTGVYSEHVGIKCSETIDAFYTKNGILSKSKLLVFVK